MTGIALANRQTVNERKIKGKGETYVFQTIFIDLLANASLYRPLPLDTALWKLSSLLQIEVLLVSWRNKQISLFIFLREIYKAINRTIRLCGHFVHFETVPTQISQAKSLPAGGKTRLVRELVISVFSVWLKSSQGFYKK